jgi:hypothetical protein
MPTRTNSVLKATVSPACPDKGPTPNRTAAEKLRSNDETREQLGKHAIKKEKEFGQKT